MDPAITYYDRNADALAARYDRLVFADVHGGLLPWLPPPPAKLLDIGSGSGRDAAALARLGFAVTAIEPAPAMLRRARGAAGDLRVEWLEDRLPTLVSLAGREGEFAFILCSAVLMHLPAAALAGALARMRALLLPAGHVGITLRGPSWADADGLFHDHGHEVLAAAVAAADLSIVHRRIDADRLGRGALRWRTYILAA